MGGSLFISFESVRFLFILRLVALKGKYFRIVVLSSILIALFLDLPGFMVRLNRDMIDSQVHLHQFIRFGFRFVAHFMGALILFQFNISWKYLKFPKIGAILRFWPVAIFINLVIVLIISRLIMEVEHFDHMPGRRFFRFHFLNISAVSLVVVVMLVSRLIELLIRNQEVAIENERLKTENLQNQYSALKNQLDPHFLFNSLNTLLDLIEDDKKLATGFVTRLSEVFRYLLSHSKAELIPLKQEIEFVNNYLYLLKLRHPNLTVDLNLSGQSDTSKWKVPPLALQLLIENAVKHNEVSKSKPLVITVTEEKNKLVVTNVIQPKKQMEPSEGMGLHNLMKRYEILSGDEVTVQKQDGIFKVTIPLIL